MADVDPNVQIESLKARVVQLEAVVDNFPGGLLLLDEDLNVVLCNAQHKQLLEFPEALFAKGQLSLEDIFRFNAERGEYGPGDVDEHVRMRMSRARAGLAHVVERTRPNGTVVEIRGAPLPKGGFVVTYVDVTERRRQEALIAHLAHHDPLTNLPNRLLLVDRLAQALARVRRGEALALHYLDLDSFKPVNDTHGHAIGDALLVEIAKRFRDATREVDTVARIGGDEFVVLQSGVHQASDIETLAQRLLRTISCRHVVGDTQLDIGVSIGIAVAPLDGDDPDELMRKADEALYVCKGRGGKSFQLYSAECARGNLAMAV